MPQHDIYADLKRDHDKHRALLKEIAGLKGDGDKRKSLFEAFRVEVSAHAAAEEESLYATMLGNPELRDEARHSVAEHKEVDDLMGEMVDLDPASGEWEEKFAHLRHRYEHHIEEEEEEMFPAAEAKLDAATEEKLAEVYEDRKPKELDLAKDAPAGGDDRE